MKKTKVFLIILIVFSIILIVLYFLSEDVMVTPPAQEHQRSNPVRFEKHYFFPRELLPLGVVLLCVTILVSVTLKKLLNSC